MISKHLTALSMIVACAAAACGGSDDKPAASANDVTTTTSTTADPTPVAPPPVASAAPAVDPTPAAAPTPPPAPAPVTLTDAQIAKVVWVANQSEIDAAKLAKSNGKNADVKKFAGHMVTDHQDAEKKEGDLLKKKKITPADSDISTKITGDSTTMNASLKGTKGADFDKQYMDGQVKMHQALLDQLDNTLLPQTQDADLKTLLTTIRGKVADHLKMAQDIQSKL